MNITIRDPESSNTSFGNSSSNYKFAFTPSNQSTPTSTPASGDQFQVSAETIKAGIEKEKDFNISSSDNRIEQTSMKLYSKQLNTIKALNASGKLTEMLEQVGSNDRNNSWGYSLEQILDKAKIKRNGAILSSEELLEALTNDKDGKIKESINNAISDIQGASSFKKKLEKANEKYDTEPVKVGGAIVGAGTLSAAYQMGVPELADKKIVHFRGTRTVGAGFKAMGGKVANSPVGQFVGKFVVDPVKNIVWKKLATTTFFRGLPAILGIATGNAALLAGAIFPPGLIGFAVGTAAWMVADYALKKVTGKDSSEHLQQVTSPVTGWVGDRFSEASDVAGYHLSKLV